MQQAQQQLACTRRPLVVLCGVSGRSAARRKSKQRRQQKQADKVWRSQTDKQEVEYSVLLPPSLPPPTRRSSRGSPLPPPQFPQDSAALPPPQFYDEDEDDDAAWLQQSSQQQQLLVDALFDAGQPLAYDPAKPPSQQQQGQPGSVLGPAAAAGPVTSADALWVERRRSAKEQQEFRQQQRRSQQANAKPQHARRHSLPELLATTDQVEQLRREGYQQAVAAAAAAAGRQGRQRRSNVSQPQQLERPQPPQPGVTPAVAQLSTDALWQQLQQLQDACVLRQAGRPRVTD